MKVAFYTLGCKVNFYETEALLNLFKNHNYEIVDFKNKADVYIINTCSVTNYSEAKSRKYIRKAIKQNKEAIVVAMGCYSQIAANEINEIDGVSIIVGSNNKMKVLDYVEQFKKDKKNVIDIENLKDVSFEDMEVVSFENRTRAFVKIQDGCRNYCSFCIIPYTRGPLRSKSKEKVIKEISNLVNNGYLEIVLTGIHIGYYGVDLKDCNLSKLLKEIVKIKGLKRLRISSIEVTEIKDELLNIIKDNNIIANHFHIPLQSGSDKILKLMNRNYNTEFFINKINNIRKIRPDVAITTDVIVGFPGETDKDFKDTYEFIEKISFSSLHVFPYSKKKNTKAAIMNNQVDSNIKKQRVSKLNDLSKKLEIKYMNQFIGQKVEVIPEIVNDEMLIGHSSNYLKVKYQGYLNDIGKMKIIKLDKINYPYIIGKKQGGKYGKSIKKVR